MLKIVALLITSMAVAWYLSPILKAATPKSDDIVMQLLGGTAEVASKTAYREADIYFHGGAMEKCSDESHHHSVNEHTANSSLPGANALVWLNNVTAPKEHKHLADKEIADMLPWFIVAARLDPHNIEAYRVGSYWFYRSGYIRKALDMLADGINKNPSDYRLYYDRGILYHKMKFWKMSVRDLNKALELWSDNNEDSDIEKHGIERFLEDSKKHIK